MVDILISGLDDDVMERLKKQAARHGRSLEDEARSILESAAAFTPAETRRMLEKWQRRFAGRKMVDSVESLREDRER